MHKAELSNIAMMSVLSKGKKTMFDALQPIVLDIICRINGDVAEPSVVKERLLSDFDIVCPSDTVKMLMDRLVKSEKVLTYENGIYLINRTQVWGHSIAKKAIGIRNEHGYLRAGLITYAKDHHNTEWTDSQAESALESLIEENKFELIADAHAGRPWTPSEQQAKAIAADYALWLRERRPDEFGYLVRLVEGYILQSFIRADKLDTSDRKFNETTLYFDSNFLFCLIGLEGRIRQQACEELIDFAKLENAALAVFEDTIIEMSAKLRSCARQLEIGDFLNANGIYAYMIENEWSSDAIEAQILGLVDSIEHYDISVVARPIVSPDTMFIDESQLEQAITKERKSHDDADNDAHKTGAIIHDLRVISAVYALRGGVKSQWIENSGAVFVTSSPRLVTAVSKFHEHAEIRGEQAAVLDTWLTSVLWLKNPRRGNKVATLALAAECYSALQPTRELWKSYITCVEKMKEDQAISGDNYVLLTRSREAKIALSTAPIADYRYVNTESVGAIMRHTTQSVRAEKDAELRAYKEASSAMLDTIRAERDSEAEKFSRQRNYIQTIADGCGKRAYKTTLWIGISAIILGTIVSLLPSIPDWAAWSARLVTIITTIYSSMRAICVGNIYAVAEDARKRAVKRTLLRLTPPDTKHAPDTVLVSSSSNKSKTGYSE